MDFEGTFINAAIELWGLRAEGIKPTSGGHFSQVYEVRGERGACILRLTPPGGGIDLASMQAIAAWLSYLSEHGGPVSKSILSRNGNWVEEVENEGQIYLASVSEKAPGVLAEGMRPEDWSDDLFRALGRAVGRCHRLACDYSSPSLDLRRPDWDETSNCFNPRDNLLDADPLILEKRAAVLETLATLPKDVEYYGLCHLDLHFGNFFVDIPQQQIMLFDFDDCAYGWYAMDIAMLLTDVLVVYKGVERGEFGARFQRNLLQGYREEFAIDAEWVARLPLFIKLLVIGLYLMLYRDYDPAQTDGWVGKFMVGRRERILGDVPYLP